MSCVTFFRSNIFAGFVASITAAHVGSRSVFVAQAAVDEQVSTVASFVQSAAAKAVPHALAAAGPVESKEGAGCEHGPCAESNEAASVVLAPAESKEGAGLMRQMLEELQKPMKVKVTEFMTQVRSQWNNVHNADVKSNVQCRICFQPMRASVISVLPCGHMFCCGCLGRWLPLKKTCPTCRTSFQYQKRR